MSTLYTTKKEPPSLGNSSRSVAAEFTQSCRQRPGKTPQARWPGRSRGSSTVEFAIVGSLFFLLMFMVMDFAAYSFIKLTMQHAVREGARYAVTGQVDLDPQAKLDRRRAVIQKIR